ncbi:MAG: SDR family oxidoreductase [Planctomycetes bacterium]|nr:SDR family oxidoreductase [Planctomycetota bacterium]
MRRKPRVLVTGGAGFIGSHLCEALLARGSEVLCLDNLFSGDKANVAHLLPDPSFEFLRHDVIQPVLLEADRIFHLACPAAPVHYRKNPVKTVKVNVMGTLNMLGLAKRVKARILLASTSEVYGDPKECPQTEAYWGHVNPVGPRSCYDEGKRVAETLMTDYRRQNGVDARIARIFNTYGPRLREDDGRVVPAFIGRALRGEPLTVHGDGAQTRSFCHVDDLVEGLLRLMDLEAPPEEAGRPVNLGNPEEVTILDLARRVIAAAGSRSRVEFAERPSDDPGRRCPDVSRARLLLGWEPRIGLDEGLKRTVPWFRGRTA